MLHDMVLQQIACYLKLLADMQGRRKNSTQVTRHAT